MNREEDSQEELHPEDEEMDSHKHSLPRRNASGNAATSLIIRIHPHESE